MALLDFLCSVAQLMNEYRVPELNVQNGVLKAMSFLFEYIGEMGKDYGTSRRPISVVLTQLCTFLIRKAK